jgi:molecular chaperone GrpE
MTQSTPEENRPLEEVSSPPVGEPLARDHQTPQPLVDESEAATFDGINLEGLHNAVNLQIEPPPPATILAGRDSSAAVIEELAEDMLNLLRRAQALESTNAEILARMDRFDQALNDVRRHFVQELGTLRRDLLGERKALVALSTFQAVVPTLDSLQTMRVHPSVRKAKQVRTQVEALIGAMTTVLRSLGIEEFKVTKGEPFDPARMECAGYAKGKPGTVLDVVRPGYTAGGTVVRPAGVRIAEPQTIA